jgi:ribonuclease HI
VALWSNLAKREAQIVDYTLIPEIRIDAWAVDGACAGVPGPMEYRGVRVADGAELFRIGPYAGGTNNIAEYLAIIHAAALLMRANDSTTPIYSDSKTALSWIRRGRSNSTIAATAENAQLRAVLARADAWLATHRIPNPIIKWETEKWGEIPADFGRK